MYSPTTWEIVPNSRIEMDPHEHILTLKTVFLKSEASLSGRKQYIAIGTSNICGEDYQRKSVLFFKFKLLFEIWLKYIFKHTWLISAIIIFYK